MGDRIDQHQCQQKCGDVARGDNLRGRHLRAEIFRHRIQKREESDRTAHQGDAGEPLAAFVVDVFHKGFQQRD
jgi:hypothetical protein